LIDIRENALATNGIQEVDGSIPFSSTNKIQRLRSFPTPISLNFSDLKLQTLVLDGVHFAGHIV
jgi:hypothetical protein